MMNSRPSQRRRERSPTEWDFGSAPKLATAKQAKPTTSAP
jgi:hypothetical protein